MCAISQSNFTPKIIGPSPMSNDYLNDITVWYTKILWLSFFRWQTVTIELRGLHTHTHTHLIVSVFMFSRVKNTPLCLWCWEMLGWQLSLLMICWKMGYMSSALATLLCRKVCTQWLFCIDTACVCVCVCGRGGAYKCACVCVSIHFCIYPVLSIINHWQDSRL